MKFFKYIFLILIFLSLLFSSCSSTKFVKDNEYLLNKLKVNVDSREISNNDIKSVIKQKPNVKILGAFKFHLGLYNLSSKNNNNGFSKWLRRIGEEPVIYDEFKTKRSVKQIKQYLKNKGYYNVVVTDSLTLKAKKATIRYNVKLGKPYVYNKIYRQLKDLNANFYPEKLKKLELENSHKLRKYLVRDSMNSILKNLKKVDSDQLDDERFRISKMLRNKGYYDFSKENVHFHLDSALNDNKMDVFIGIDKPALKNKYHKYYFGKITVFLDFDKNKNIKKDTVYDNSLDSIVYKNILFVYKGKLKIKPNLIKRNIYFTQGELYKLKNIEESYKALQGLRQYKFVNIKFEKKDNNILDCIIQLTPLKRQSYIFEIEGTNSSGNLGATGSFTYQHRNIFKGAEIFSLKFSGAKERVYASKKQTFDASEIAGELKLNLPQFLIPFFSADKFKREYKPKTLISLSLSYQKRPDYTRTIADASFGYYWKSAGNIKHTLNPIELNFIQVKNLSEDFISSIRNKYISNSFKDHLITNTRYSLLYTNKKGKKDLDYHYVMFNAEVSGNTLNALNKLFNAKEKNTSNENNIDDKYYSLFNVRYSQYVKADIEYRFNHYMNRANSIVYRFFGGIGIPYGNLKMLPFSKSYFSGGANGIRAWQIRSLGPGSYSDNSLFYNNAADIKLEANIEYRFKLIWSLEGAIFIDAGNIWSISKKDDREGASFKMNKFYKQIAIGTGSGLRADLNFIILRLDLGFKLKDPSLDSGSRWLRGSDFFRGSNITYNIGLGYPF